ncbi:MAG TPA: aminotransferase class III-fold pyridoxal phosphate-dependent enzyme [Gaiellaceae bacterium]|jgi:adenosylmethionine-8-amino-7-oxononanoate aminotransferase
MTALWHPFADMAVVDGSEVVIERGDGAHVIGEDGRRYLDGTASLWYCNVGYGRSEIAEAVGAQLERLHAFHIFGEYASRPTLELAERIASIAPVADSKVFFTSGGSDSVDTAAKLARRYFEQVGEPDRTLILTRDWAYHGMHAYGTALAGIGVNRLGGVLIPDVAVVPWDSAAALAATVDELGAERIAAFFCEPVMGAGGVRPAPPGYLEAAREIVRATGALWISDEVITGFGRVGDWFASTRFSLDPDLVTFAKGVTSGYLPLGGVLASPRVAEPFWQAGAGAVWRHGYTYSGHTTACVAGLVNLDLMEREGLHRRALQLEGVLHSALAPLAEHELVGEVRGGVGLLAAVQLDPSLVEADPSLPGRAAAACREAGLITRALAGGGLQVSPSLVITEAEIAELAELMRAGLDRAAAGAPRAAGLSASRP